MIVVWAGSVTVVQATPINWTSWYNVSLGNSPSSFIFNGNIVNVTGASQALTGISVAFSGLGSFSTTINGFPNWLPSSYYMGGIVDNAPLEVQPQGPGALQGFSQARQVLGAGFVSGGTDTIMFSEPVTNAILAIQNPNNSNPTTLTFSSGLSVLNLGTGNLLGCLSVTTACTITIPATAPNSPLPLPGGLVEIVGTNITSFSWITNSSNAVANESIGFTVGIHAIPEPNSFLLFAAGLIGLGFSRSKPGRMGKRLYRLPTRNAA